MGNFQPQPFTNFGLALKTLRESRNKTPEDLCGAIEIDMTSLEAYENGAKRPPEDVLELIIQHFSLQEKDAGELWRLAGYIERGEEMQLFHNDDNSETRKLHTGFVSPQDAKIVYTDMVQIMANNFGVIVTFLQGAGVNNQPLAVSRVGMSREHARSLLQVLQKTLEQADEVNAKPPKHLPSGPKKPEQE